MMGLEKIFKDPFYRLARRMFLILLGVAVATKITFGAFAFVVLAAGARAAASRKPAYALICFFLLPFMSILNPMVFGFGSLLSVCARVGIPILALVMLSAAKTRPGNRSVPILSVLIYIAVAAISSVFGYAPLISFLKIVNFVFFVLGLYAGTMNLEKRPDDLLQLRAFFVAFAVFIVLGSLILHFVNPFAAHYTAYGWEMAVGGVEVAVETMSKVKANTGSYGYLCGIVNHSQCLGPTTTCIAGWLLCDMLFVEKRMMPGHLLVLACCPIVLYMTASRTSLLGFIVLMLLVPVYCVPKFRVPTKIKFQVQRMSNMFFVSLALGAVVLEVANGGMSRWLMKYGEDKSADAITLDSVTATRRGVMEVSMYEFRQSPLIGNGFQVAYEHQLLKKDWKSMLSAPIEKGFIPTMILGETGVLGAIAFVAFLIAFYGGCVSRGYWTTLALFTVYLSTNLGEATFFSPGGTGGPQWIYSLAGGFIVDVAAFQRKQQEQMEQMPGKAIRP